MVRRTVVANVRLRVPYARSIFTPRFIVVLASTPSYRCLIIAVGQQTFWMTQHRLRNYSKRAAATSILYDAWLGSVQGYTALPVGPPVYDIAGQRQLKTIPGIRLQRQGCPAATVFDRGGPGSFDGKSVVWLLPPHPTTAKDRVKAQGRKCPPIIPSASQRNE